MSFSSTAANVYQVADDTGIVDAIGNYVGGLFGGDHDVRDDGPCPGQPTASQLRLVQLRATPAEKRQLEVLWNVENAPKRFPWEDPIVFGSLAMGGYNCRITAESERNLANYLRDLVSKYTGATTATPVVQVPDTDPSVWERIKQEFGEAAANAAAAAVEETRDAVDDVTDPIVHERVVRQTQSQVVDQFVPIAIGAVLFALIKGVLS